MFFSLYIRNTTDSTNQINVFKRILVVNTVVLSIAAIYESVVLGALRPEATMTNPNYMSYYICLGLVAILTLYNDKRKFLIWAIGFFAVYLSGSYSCVFASIVCLLFYFANKAQSVIWTRLLIGFTVVGAFFLVITMSMSLEITAVFSGAKGGTLRNIIWSDAFDQFKHHPLLGVGYNTYYYETPDKLFATHNDLVRIIVELGVIGIVAIGYRIKKAVYSLSLVNGEARQCFTMFIVTTILFSMFHNNMNSLLFWLVFSLPEVYSVLWNEEQSGEFDI